MPHRSPIPGSPGDWLLRAKGSLAQARQPKAEGGYWEDLCYLAQQAAEKAIKAVYQKHGWSFRYTHDIESLLSGLESKGIEVPPRLKKTVTLTKYAFRTRYPGMSDPVRKREYLKAIRLAENAVAWADRQLRKTD